MVHRAARLVVVGINYPPEKTGVAPYTGAMSRGLIQRGFLTRVITAHPHYPGWKVLSGYGQWSRDETIQGVTVNRVRHYVPRAPNGLRRALSELSFGIRAVLARWGSPDVIIAVSPALIASWLVILRSRVTNRHAATVVWVQDLYSLGLSETNQGNKVALRVMSAIEGYVLRSASRVIVIHERFAHRVSEDFGVPLERIEVIRNWTHIPSDSPTTDPFETREKLNWLPAETVVLHAGNMGVKQGLDNVIAAAQLADDRAEDVRFVFVGGGSEQTRLQQLAMSASRVEFLEPLPSDEFVAALHAADILLINEKEGVAEMAVPSKLTSYFSAGKPVIAATDQKGITAEEIRRAEAGVVVPAGDPVALLDGVLALAADAAMAARLGANGKRYRKTVLDEETALDRITEILDSLVSDGSDVSRST